MPKISMDLAKKDPAFIERFGEEPPAKVYRYMPDQILAAYRYYLLCRDAALAQMSVEWFAFLEAMHAAHEYCDRPEFEADYLSAVREELDEKLEIIEKGKKALEDATLHWSPLWLTWLDATRVFKEIEERIGDSEVIPGADSEKAYQGRYPCRWWWLGPKELAPVQEETKNEEGDCAQDSEA